MEFCWKSKTSNFHWGLGSKAPLIETTTEILSLIELPIEITAIVLAVVNDINVDCNLLNCSIFYQQREAMMINTPKSLLSSQLKALKLAKKRLYLIELL